MTSSSASATPTRSRRAISAPKGCPKLPRQRSKRSTTTSFRRLLQSGPRAFRRTPRRGRPRPYRRDELPVPKPTPEQAAASVALENSRSQYRHQARHPLFMRHPDVVQTARDGEPTVDPKPTLAPAVTKRLTDQFNAAMNPNAAKAPAAATTASETPPRLRRPLLRRPGNHSCNSGSTTRLPGSSCCKRGWHLWIGPGRQRSRQFDSHAGCNQRRQQPRRRDPRLESEREAY